MGVRTPQEFHFADFTLDQARYRLERGEHRIRLEKLPMELLILLVERGGELVLREEIADRLWGKDVFLDVDHSINIAVRKIRVALRDDPEKPRFLETVVGKGYRFAAPVRCGNGNGSVQVATLPPEASPAPDAPSTTEKTHTSRLRFVWVTVGALVVCVIALILIRAIGAKGIRQPAIKSLAVLPLKNLSGDPAQEYFADGMTEALIGRLAMIRDLRVISRTSVMRFKNSNQSIPEIAKALHVDAIVEGSVIRDGGRVRVHAQLIRAASDDHFWSETYDHDLGDTLTLQSDVAESIAQKVKVTVTGEEHSRLVAARHVSPDVYESYLKGQFPEGGRRADIEESIRNFEDAISKDATFAPAYVGLAGAYDKMGSIFVGASPAEVRPKVISAARKALELDPGLAEAHVYLARVYQQQWQWAEAETEYRQALDLNPNDATAHSGLAGWLMCQGRMEEALAWSQRGRELDPLGISGTQVGWILFHAHRYDEAVRELRGALAVHPDNEKAQWFLGFALIGNKQYEEAISLLEKTASTMHRSPGSLEILATAYAKAGRRSEALRLMSELKERRRSGYVPAGAFINAYLALGDYDEAFAGFERAYLEKSSILQFLKVHPFFDPVRGDPRFQNLMRRVNLN